MLKLAKSLLAKEPSKRPSAYTAFTATWTLLRKRDVSCVESLHAMPRREPGALKPI